MTANDFAAWVAMMKETRGWTKSRCANALGCGVNQIKVWSTNGAPEYIGLAAAALAHPLAPWRKP